MEVRSAELPRRMRQTPTEWGMVLAPGEARVAESRRARSVRLLAGGASLILAALALAAPLGVEIATWVRVLAAAAFVAKSAVFLWPRSPDVRVEVEVDVDAGEVRVVECRGDARAVISREPIGEVNAIEVGRTIVSLRNGLDPEADASRSGASFSPVSGD